MKTLILITIACMVLNVSHSLPNATSAEAEDTHDAPSAHEASAVLSDPNSPLRVHVKHYTSIYVAAFKEITTKALNDLPLTEPYEKPRHYLTKFLERNDMFINELVNCIWNIVDLSFSVRKTHTYLARPEATAEEQETLQLLTENGFNDVRKELGKIWWRFIEQEFGSDYNEDYC